MLTPEPAMLYQRPPARARDLVRHAASWIRHRVFAAPGGVRSPWPGLTHVPVLLALGRFIPITQVVELGSGDWSTRIFLDRDLFPELTALHVAEDQEYWSQRCQHRYGSDPRLQMQVCPAGVAQSLEHLPLRESSLVLVDDSISLAGRVATIRAIGQLRSGLRVVAIHDFEIKAYAEAAFEAGLGKPHAVINALGPATALYWCAENPAPTGIAGLDAVLSACGSIPVWDVQAWECALEQAIGPRPLIAAAGGHG